jgi:hypothetical protein
MGALILLGIISALCIFAMLAARFGVDTRIQIVDPRYPTDRPGLG